MPTIFDGLNIGKSGLYTNQMSMNVAGNNVSNVNTPGYSRERVEVVSSTPMFTQPGTFGTGSEVSEITSARDSLIDKRVRLAYNDQAFYEKMSSTLGEIGNIFNEENGVGLKQSLEDFFNSWHALALNPDLETARQQVLEKGQTLSSNINSVYSSLEDVKKGLDNQMGTTAQEINSLSKRIAELNYEISKGELGDKDHANSLRDTRSVLIDQLNKLSNITVMEGSYDQNTKPEMTILLGGKPIVSGITYNEISAQKLNGKQYNSVYFLNQDGTRTDITKKITKGELGAEINARDNVIDSYQDDLNDIAQTLIQSVNKVHSASTGLTAYTQVAGTSSIKDTSVILSSKEATGFDSDVKTGAFKLKITDKDGNSVGDFTIAVNADDTLDSLKNKFNSALSGYASMSVSSINQGNIQIKSQEGYKFSFTDDTSGFLSAAGINTFFDGHNAKDIKLNAVMKNDPSKIAAGKTLQPGDGSSAESIAQIQLTKTMENNTQSIDEYYNAFLGKIGSTQQRYADTLTAKNAIVQQLKTDQQSIEGVSLDEEASNLIKYQRAYQASAKFISVIDEMTQTLIGMIK